MPLPGASALRPGPAGAALCAGSRDTLFRGSGAVRFRRIVRSFDVVVTAAIFELIKGHAGARAAVDGAALICGFTSAYRGKWYGDIAVSDPEYLQWIVEPEKGIKHSSALLVSR
jgi:hypothetical protein